MSAALMLQVRRSARAGWREAPLQADAAEALQRAAGEGRAALDRVFRSLFGASRRPHRLLDAQGRVLAIADRSGW